MHAPLALVTENVIDLDALRSYVAGEQNGAIAEFLGIVRNHDHGKVVVSLEYQVHPDAAASMHRIVDDIASANPEVAIAAAHRYGRLAIGDVAFAVAVSSAHRGPAFEVLRNVVETVKAELPIWKRQEFADGSHEWVNFA